MTSTDVQNAVARSIALALDEHMRVIDAGGQPAIERAVVLVSGLRAWATIIEEAIPKEIQPAIGQLTDLTTKQLRAALQAANKR